MEKIVYEYLKKKFASSEIKLLKAVIKIIFLF